MQADGVFKELEAQSVLDFYVHESCQRQGIGKQLFEVRRGFGVQVQMALLG